MNPSSFSITTPPQWWDLPLDPENRLDELTRLVDERAPAALQPSERSALVSVLDETAEAATAQGAVFASQFGLVDQTAGFSASVIAAVRHDPGGLDDLDTPHADEIDLEVREVELAVGPTLRRRSRRRLGQIDSIQVQYFVPAGDETMVVISGSSIGLDDPADAVRIFDAIVATMRIDTEQAG